MMTEVAAMPGVSGSHGDFTANLKSPDIVSRHSVSDLMADGSSNAGDTAFPTALQHAKAVATAPGLAAIILPALILYGTDHVPLLTADAEDEVRQQAPSCKSPV